IKISKEDSYSNFMYYYNIISLHDYNNLKNETYTLNEDEFILFINEQPQYTGGLNDIRFFEIKDLRLIKKHEDIEQSLSFIGQSSVFIIVHPNVWEQLLQDSKNVVSVHNYINLSNWKDSLTAVEKLKSLLAIDTWDYATEDSLFSSKIESYSRMRTENAILFYLISFLSILFFLGNFLLLYLNLIADIELERKKFDKLYKIGITKKEW